MGRHDFPRAFKKIGPSFLYFFSRDSLILGHQCRSYLGEIVTGRCYDDHVEATFNSGTYFSFFISVSLHAKSIEAVRLTKGFGSIE